MMVVTWHFAEDVELRQPTHPMTPLTGRYDNLGSSAGGRIWLLVAAEKSCCSYRFLLYNFFLVLAPPEGMCFGDSGVYGKRLFALIFPAPVYHVYRMSTQMGKENSWGTRDRRKAATASAVEMSTKLNIHTFAIPGKAAVARLSGDFALRSKRCYAVFISRCFGGKRVICAKMDHFWSKTIKKEDYRTMKNLKRFCPWCWRWPWH